MSLIIEGLCSGSVSVYELECSLAVIRRSWRHICCDDNMVYFREHAGIGGICVSSFCFRHPTLMSRERQDKKKSGWSAITIKQWLTWIVSWWWFIALWWKAVGLCCISSTRFKRRSRVVRWPDDLESMCILWALMNVGLVSCCWQVPLTLQSWGAAALVTENFFLGENMDRIRLLQLLKALKYLVWLNELESSPREKQIIQQKCRLKEKEMTY